MTRDEAIKIEMKNIKRYLTGQDIALIATAKIDALIELGVLKVEEPKTPYQKIADYLSSKDYNLADMANFQAALDTHNLKIVEK